MRVIYTIMAAIISLSVLVGCKHNGKTPSGNISPNEQIVPNATASANDIKDNLAKSSDILTKTSEKMLLEMSPTEIKKFSYVPMVMASESSRLITMQDMVRGINRLLESANTTITEQASIINTYKTKTIPELETKVSDATSDATRQRNAKLNWLIVSGVMVSVGGLILMGISTQMPIPVIGKSGGAVFGGGIVMSVLALLYMNLASFMDGMRLPMIIGTCILGVMVLAFLGWILWLYAKSMKETVVAVEKVKENDPKFKLKLKEIGPSTQSKFTQKVVDNIKAKIKR